MDPASANRNLQALALDQVRFPRTLPLLALMAYSSDGRVEDVTTRVQPDGSLEWTAPAGSWTLYALFQGWHGKQVERAAPGGEGDVIDHFSRDAIRTYLAAFDRAFAGHDVSPIRAFFNDSYEVDDASGQADWTPRLFEEFQARRGYDLRQHVPALLGEDTPERSARVLTDYRETVSDLVLGRLHGRMARVGGRQAGDRQEPVARVARQHPGPLRRERHPRDRGHRPAARQVRLVCGAREREARWRRRKPPRG